MESVESVCLDAGGALRLKLGQVQIPSGPHTVLRTTYAFESPRAEGLLKILWKIASTRDYFTQIIVNCP